jgi:hypothetical protein
MIIPDANAAPKQQKSVYHSKTSGDPNDISSYEYNDGYNFNGPSIHQNCKTTHSDGIS